jgi:predicted phosphodiesterase
MRIGVVSDVHSNLEAFSAVLEVLDREGVSLILNAGDLVGYCANPNECVSLASETIAASVAGNHDLAVLNSSNTEFFNRNAKKSSLWTRENLAPFSFGYLYSLPLETYLEDLNIHLAHSEICFPALFDYTQTSYDASFNFPYMAESSICFVGHSHVPIVFLENEGITYSDASFVQIPENARAIVNVGSVGQPRDGNSRSCFALYDTDTRTITFQRISYNVTKTVEKISSSGLPAILGDRLHYGR